MVWSLVNDRGREPVEKITTFFKFSTFSSHIAATSEPAHFYFGFGLGFSVHWYNMLFEIIFPVYMQRTPAQARRAIAAHPLKSCQCSIVGRTAHFLVS